MNVNQSITLTALTNQFIPGTLVQVVWSSINVRTGPGTSYSIISTESYGAQGVIDFGTQVSNNGYIWATVTYSDGMVGWSAVQGLTSLGASGYYTENDNFWPSSIAYVTAFIFKR